MRSSHSPLLMPSTSPVAPGDAPARAGSELDADELVDRCRCAPSFSTHCVRLGLGGADSYYTSTPTEDGGGERDINRSSWRLDGRDRLKKMGPWPVDGCGSGKRCSKARLLVDGQGRRPRSQSGDPDQPITKSSSTGAYGIGPAYSVRSGSSAPPSARHVARAGDVKSIVRDPAARKSRPRGGPCAPSVTAAVRRSGGRSRVTRGRRRRSRKAATRAGRRPPGSPLHRPPLGIDRGEAIAALDDDAHAGAEVRTPRHAGGTHPTAPLCRRPPRPPRRGSRPARSRSRTHRHLGQLACAAREDGGSGKVTDLGLRLPLHQRGIGPSRSLAVDHVSGGNFA